MTDVRPVAPSGQFRPAVPSWCTPRLASRSLQFAIGTLVASMAAISLFFAGAGAFWGPVNDLLVVATVLLLLPAMAVLPGVAGEHVGGWLAWSSAAAGIGVLVIAGGQVALVAGVITLDASFIAGGLGVLPIIVWLGATAVPAWRMPVLGRTVAGWAIAFMALAGLTVLVLAAGTADTPTLTALLGMPLMVVLVGWMLSLARGLARVASAP